MYVYASSLAVNPCMSRIYYSDAVIHSTTTFGERNTECKVFECDDSMKAFSLHLTTFSHTFNLLDVSCH
jgi:hypothetical protein